MKISYDNILVRHWLLFDYDLKDFYLKEPVHYLFKLKNSIHYKSLVQDDYSDYIRLIKTTNQYEHSLEKFLKLKDTFNIDFLTEEKNRIILEWIESYNKYVVIDGCHRLSIMMYKGINTLDTKWFTIKNINKNGK
jgi:hypothetical protein